VRIYARIVVDEAQAGAMPIVFIHGLCISGRYLTPTAERLAPHFPVYVPDLPGAGRSGTPDHVLTTAELADVLTAWMSAMNLREATFLGNSFGCQVIAHLAVRRPDLVAAAILVSPTVDPTARSAIRQLWRLALDAPRERPSLLLIAPRDYLRFGFRRGYRALRIMLADRIEEKLPRISVPTLVVRGSRDPIVPQRWAERVAALLPKGELAVIPGAAHAVNYDRPDELAIEVIRFLGKRV
jgi:pimeloyl-ACP methyl ester carboxylesterase